VHVKNLEKTETRELTTRKGFRLDFPESGCLQLAQPLRRLKIELTPENEAALAQYAPLSGIPQTNSWTDTLRATWRLAHGQEARENQTDKLFYWFVDFGKNEDQKDEYSRPVVHVLPSTLVAKALSTAHQKWLDIPGNNAGAIGDDVAPS